MTSFLIRKMIELNLSFGVGSDVANQGAINVEDLSLNFPIALDWHAEFWEAENCFDTLTDGCH